MYTETITSQINTVAERLNYAKEYLKDWFTRKEYIILHKDISSATASRDLKEGIEKNVLFKRGELNQAKYKFML